MFYGILISMYVLDTEKHHLPHIHVRYNEFKASIAIPDGTVLNGNSPTRQMKLVQAWIELHQDVSFPISTWECLPLSSAYRSPSGA